MGYRFEAEKIEEAMEIIQSRIDPEGDSIEEIDDPDQIQMSFD